MKLSILALALELFVTALWILVRDADLKAFVGEKLFPYCGVPLGLCSLGHFLFVLKLGPLGWLSEWGKLNMLDFLREVFSTYYLVIIFNGLGMICAILQLCSIFPLLSYLGGTVVGIISGSYRFVEFFTKYITFQNGKWSTDPPEKSTTDWIRDGISWGIAFLITWIILFINSYFLHYAALGDRLSSILVKYGWMVSLGFGVLAALVYFIEKLKFYR